MDQIFELSPPILLAVVLNLIGLFLKKSPLADWVIPLVLILLGAVVYPFIAEVGKVSYAVSSPTIFNGVMGAAIGGFSVGANQVFRQWKSGRSQSGETQFIKRQK